MRVGAYAVIMGHSQWFQIQIVEHDLQRLSALFVSYHNGYNRLQILLERSSSRGDERRVSLILQHFIPLARQLRKFLQQWRSMQCLAHQAVQIGE